MKAKFIIWAKSAAFDGVTSLLNVSGVYEEIESISFPAIVRETVLVLLTEREEKDPKKPVIELYIDTPKTKKIPVQKITIDFEKKTMNRLIVAIPALVLEHTGIISFKASYKNKPLAEYSVKVKKADKLHL